MQNSNKNDSAYKIKVVCGDDMIGLACTYDNQLQLAGVMFDIFYTFYYFKNKDAKVIGVERDILIYFIINGYSNKIRKEYCESANMSRECMRAHVHRLKKKGYLINESSTYHKVELCYMLSVIRNMIINNTSGFVNMDLKMLYGTEKW